MTRWCLLIDGPFQRETASRTTPAASLREAQKKKGLVDCFVVDFGSHHDSFVPHTPPFEGEVIITMA